MRTCYRCGGEIPTTQRVLRDEECPHCAQDLHCCRNCRFHDPAVSNQCAEPQADYVVDKERANFCEFFAFQQKGAALTSRPQEAGSRGRSQTETAREAWRKLFRDS
jgi:hypothetical protein